MKLMLPGIAAACLLLVCCQHLAAQDTVLAWYPSHVGDTWVYQREELDGGIGGGMANPDTGRWRVEETIVRSVKIPEGILLLKRARALDPLPATARRIPSIKEVKDSYSLIRGDCVYRAEVQNDQLTPQYRDALLRGNVSAEVCFPLTEGKTWGRVNDKPSYDPDDVWRVIGVNADPFGLDTGTTVHFSAREGSGTMVDRWFAKGVGILQEISEHHGTYEESRLQLLRTVIDGQARNYRLKPAHTVPLSSSDCNGYGWRHFVRADGSSSPSEDACAKYAD